MWSSFKDSRCACQKLNLWCTLTMKILRVQVRSHPGNSGSISDDQVCEFGRFPGVGLVVLVEFYLICGIKLAVVGKVV